MWVHGIFGEDLRFQGLKSEERQVNPEAAEGRASKGELGRDPPEGLYSVLLSGSGVHGTGLASRGNPDSPWPGCRCPAWRVQADGREWTR